MDYRNAFGIEICVVKDDRYQGRPVRIVGGSRRFATDVEDLWDAVTNPKRIARWFGPVSGELKLDGRYQIEGNAGGSITLCEPPKAYDLTWEYGENVSWVTVRLEPAGTETRLTLEHLTSKDEASEAHWKKYGPGATGVGFHLENGGEPFDEDEHNAWMTSPDGHTFFEKSARSWKDAHIAHGEDTAIATTMAEATADFYCGRGDTH